LTIRKGIAYSAFAGQQAEGRVLDDNKKAVDLWLRNTRRSVRRRSRLTVAGVGFEPQTFDNLFVPAPLSGFTR